MRSEVIQDVFAVAVPEAIDVADPAVREELPTFLSQMAINTTWRQYGDQKPKLEFREIDWLITKDPADVEAFQPAHDCAACRAGNDQSLAFLRDNPDRYVALANMSYVEVWP